MNLLVTQLSISHVLFYACANYNGVLVRIIALTLGWPIILSGGYLGKSANVVNRPSNNSPDRQFPRPQMSQITAIYSGVTMQINVG